MVIKRLPSRSNARIVERELARLKQEINQRLSRISLPPHGVKGVATEALRYTLLSPGHRLRALLLVAICKAISGSYKGYLNSAAAIELIHAGTLILDDLPFIDNAKLRRGKPCCHIRYGTDIAVYASYTAFDLSESLIFDTAPERVKDSLLAQLRDLKQDMIGGQCLEKELIKKKQDATYKNIRKQYYLKSGSLFGFTTRLAGIFCKLDTDNLQILRKFGEECGVAYQIADDIADIKGNPVQLGKRTKMDSGKANYPRRFGMPFAIAQFNKHHDRAMALLEQLFSNRTLKGNKELIFQIINQLHHKD